MKKGHSVKVHSPDHGIALAAVAMVIAAILILLLAAPGNNVNATQNLTQIVPGLFPTSTCIVPLFNIHSEVTNTIGLETFNVSGITDYAINPGSNGEIKYVVYVGNSSATNQNLTINATNMAKLYHASYGNETIGAGYGINISSTPTYEILASNSNYSITTNITAEPNATRGTYWMFLGPGFCLYGPNGLLTVGSDPFNGLMNEAQHKLNK